MKRLRTLKLAYDPAGKAYRDAERKALKGKKAEEAFYRFIGACSLPEFKGDVRSAAPQTTKVKKPRKKR